MQSRSGAKPIAEKSALGALLHGSCIPNQKIWTTPHQSPDTHVRRHPPRRKRLLLRRQPTLLSALRTFPLAGESPLVLRTFPQRGYLYQREPVIFLLKHLLDTKDNAFERHKVAVEMRVDTILGAVHRDGLSVADDIGQDADNMPVGDA